MHPIPIRQLPALFRDLLSRDLPAGIRCVSVLDGITNGRAFVDDAISPRWAILQEAGFGTVYWAGDMDFAAMAKIVDILRKDGDVLFGFWPDDPIRDLLPPDPDYTGKVIDFWDCDPRDGLERYLTPPEGCRLVPATAALTRGRESAELIISTMGSLEKAFEQIFGFFLMRGDTVVGEAIAGAPVRGIVEVGVETHPDYQKRGYATYLCAALIREAEQRGYQTYWNCNAGNTPSVRLAQKMGYSTAREYTLVAWEKKKTDV